MTILDKVMQIDVNTGEVIKIWNSVSEAARELKYGNSGDSITKVCKGYCRTSGGFYWAFVNKELQERFQVFPEDYKNKNFVLRDRKEVVLVNNETLEIERVFESREAIAKFLGTTYGKIANKIKELSNYKDKLFFDKKHYMENIDFLKEEFLFKRNKICEICKLKFHSYESLSTHIQFAHKMRSEEYAVEYFYKGIKPVCKFEGCDQHPRYTSPFSFMTYCKKHDKIAMSEGGKIGGLSSSWNKGLTKETDERILKQTEESSGSNNHFYGKHHTEESKEKIRISKRKNV
jgi:hypothetical protein